MQAVSSERERLEAIFHQFEPKIERTDSPANMPGGIRGPSYKMAVLLSLLHRFPERAITGTDYVASYGMHSAFPGYTPLTGAPLSPLTGCHKDEPSHSQQVTDTSSINMFFDDEARATRVSHQCVMRQRLVNSISQRTLVLARVCVLAGV